MIYDPAVIDKYEKHVDIWLEELPTDPQKQAVFDFTRQSYGNLEDFVIERKESQGNALTGKIDLMDIPSVTWNREKAISQYQLIQMFKKEALEGAIPVSDDGTLNPRYVEARNKWDEIEDDVEELENNLLEAITYYNKQMIVQVWQRFTTKSDISMMLYRQGIDTHNKNLHKEFGMMDSHYYSRGNGAFSSCTKPYERLSKHPIGKLLLLDAKEITNAAASRMGHKVKA